MKIKKHGLKVTGVRGFFVPLGKQGEATIGFTVTPHIMPEGEERFGQGVVTQAEADEVIALIQKAVVAKAPAVSAKKASKKKASKKKPSAKKASVKA